MNQKKTKNYKLNKNPQATNQSQKESPSLNQPNQTNKSVHKKSNKKKRHGAQRPPRAKAVREYTSGGIVFRIVKDKTIEIALLQDLKARWSLPKGHIESGETAKQTAIREVSEETNLKSLKIISQLDKIHFFYRLNGKLIFMTNFIFLIESTDLSEKMQTEEDVPWIVDVQWFEAEQAYDILEYKATKVIMREAINRIKKWYKI
ncbi:MAG TPA: NUDIX domain-containing protein [Candidatus Saccharibacteria bacterium]|nr:NUDIX domain-containing protein [Candidatus Saccharibacteria bacterium]HMT39414.1 NUDIX domain-containing protein [Candidatus Saccharibacteria bacterium]